MVCELTLISPTLESIPTGGFLRIESRGLFLKRTEKGSFQGTDRNGNIYLNTGQGINLIPRESILRIERLGVDGDWYQVEPKSKAQIYSIIGSDYSSWDASGHYEDLPGRIVGRVNEIEYEQTDDRRERYILDTPHGVMKVLKKHIHSQREIHKYRNIQLLETPWQDSAIHEVPRLPEVVSTKLRARKFKLQVVETRGVTPLQPGLEINTGDSMAFKLKSGALVQGWYFGHNLEFIFLRTLSEGKIAAVSRSALDVDLKDLSQGLNEKKVFLLGSAHKIYKPKYGNPHFWGVKPIYLMGFTDEHVLVSVQRDWERYETTLKFEHEFLKKWHTRDLEWHKLEDIDVQY